jgi:hypothetical protein
VRKRTKKTKDSRKNQEKREKVWQLERKRCDFKTCRVTVQTLAAMSPYGRIARVQTCHLIVQLSELHLSGRKRLPSEHFTLKI